MAAPTPSYIRLPDDTGNAGKKVRTQTRVVGSDTVHEHFFIPISRRSKTGIYTASYGNITPAAATPHTSLQGHAWLINPVGNAVKMAVRRIEVCSMVTGVSNPTVPTAFTVERVTFSGTASGAEILSLKADSTMASPTGKFYSASTGLTLATVSSNAAMYTFLLAVGITAVGCAVPAMQEWEPDEDGMPILAAGEGLVFRQGLAGIASDLRRVNINVGWEEYE